jgi:threonine dehydrogenase-like Zn-dependent dehydrogenase
MRLATPAAPACDTDWAYTKPLMKRIEAGDIDPSFVVTHPASLEDAPAMYKKFRDKEEGVIKVVLRPGR